MKICRIFSSIFLVFHDQIHGLDPRKFDLSDFANMILILIYVLIWLNLALFYIYMILSIIEKTGFPFCWQHHSLILYVATKSNSN